MFLPYHYTYFVWTIVFFIPWIILFLLRKDLRKEIIVMSVLVALGSVFTAYLWWTVDWWHPQTITGTRVGIEDFLLGFSNGGIAVVIYEELFKKRLYRRKKDHSHNIGAAVIAIFFLFVIAVLFYLLHFTSFLASSFAMLLVTGCLVFFRKDLILTSFLNGILMTLVVFPMYYFLMIFSPGWIASTWLFQHLSGILITGIPLEDLAFYFLLGLCAAPFYEYWQGLRLRKAVTKVKDI